LLVLLAPSAPGQTGSYDWSIAGALGPHPGIQRASVTVSSPRNMKIHCLRIDTRTPGLRFYTTPQSGSMETMTQTTRQFLNASQSSSKKLVAAINATAWSNFNSSEWNVSRPAQLTGLAVSEGQVVSSAEARAYPTFVMDWTALPGMLNTVTGANTAGMRTAVAGFDFILTNGVGATGDTTLNPRTAIGLSQDKRYVYFLAIDGRQTGSDGATTDEVASYLQWFGAWNGMNMDGGGSTTMAWWNPGTSASELINNPRQTSGFSFINGERHVANSLGVYYETDTTVVSWGMNQTSGNATDAADPLLDGANAGVLGGAGSYVAGPSGFGNALSLAGAGTMSTTLTGSLLANRQQVTLAAWVNLANVNQNGKYLLGLSGADGFLRVDADGFLQAGFSTSAGWVTAKAGTTGAQITGTWTHLAATFSQGTVALYLNGALAASASSPGAQISAPGSCTFGIGQIPWDPANTSARFHGLIDEVRLMNAAVSPSEAVALLGLSTLTTTYGAASPSLTFTVPGTTTSSPILVTPPAGCEISTNNTTFASTVTVGSPSSPSTTTVYVRLAERAAAGSRIGDLTTSTGGGPAQSLARVALLVWPRPVNGSFTAAGKPYDGTTLASVTGRSLTGVLGGDTVSLSGGAGLFFNPNVGTARTVNLENATLAGAQAANYTLVAVTPTTADITGTGRFAENFNLFAGGDYPYPGTPLSGWNASPQVNGLIPGIVDAGGGNQALRMSSSGGGASTWALYSTAVLPGSSAGWTYSGTAKWAATYHPSLPYYGVGGLLLSSGSNGTSGNNWIWVGYSRGDYGDTKNPARAWSGAMLEYSLGGTTGSVPLGGPAFRDFPEHAPIGLTVTRNGGTIGLSIATPLDGPLVKSHTFTGAQAAALDTLRFAGTMTYFSGFDYDNLQLVSGPLISATGTPAALTTTYGTASAATSFSVSGLNLGAGILVTPPAGFEVSTNNITFSPTVTVGAAGTVASTTVYVRLAANATAGSKSGAIALTSSGADAVNVAATTGTVGAKTLTGSFTAAGKIYDGTTTATVTGRFLTGVVGSDAVSLSGGTAAFADAAVGAGKTVTLTGATLSGAQAANYTLGPVATTTADIAAAGLAENFEGYTPGNYPQPSDPLPGWAAMPSVYGLTPAIVSPTGSSGRALRMNSAGGGATGWMLFANPVLAASTASWQLSATAKWVGAYSPPMASHYGVGGVLLAASLPGTTLTGNWLWIGYSRGDYDGTGRSWSLPILEGNLGGSPVSVPLGGPAFRDFPEHAPIALTVTRNGGTITLSIGSPLDGAVNRSHTFTGAQAAALDTLVYAGFANYYSDWEYDNLAVTALSPTPLIETWLAGAPLNAANLLKYAVGGAATINAPAEAPTASRQADRMSLTAVVRTDDPDLQVMAESSENLVNWTSNGITTQASNDQTGLAAGFQRRIFSIALADPSPAKLFLRLKVVYHP